MTTMRQHSSLLVLITWSLLIGIVLQFQQNDIVHTFCKKESPTVIEMTPESAGVLLLSPNFGVGHYGNSLSCHVQLKSADEAVGLRLQFRTFVLEAGKNCVNDFICIDGIYFCGSNLGDFIFLHIIPANNVFTIVFQTDVDVTRPGFDIAVTPVPIINGSIVSRSGSSNANLTKIYEPEKPYFDTCAVWVNKRRPKISPNLLPTERPRVAKCSCHCESDLHLEALNDNPENLSN